MDYFWVAIFATIQAITEFVPVSSSGHLVVLHALAPALPVDSVRFDVILHGGTLLAVMTYFYKDLWALLAAWLQSIFTGRRDATVRLAWLLALASVPAALTGYFFQTVIEGYLRSEMIVAGMLVAVGALFLVAERLAVQHTDMSGLTWPRAFGIGCAQALAFIPGTSRSGITIIAGMAFGLKREYALRFSFILSVPIILGANMTEVITARVMALQSGDWLLYGLGLLITWILGYVVIAYLLRFVRNHSLAVFAYYRFALAAVLVLLQFT